MSSRNDSEKSFFSTRPLQALGLDGEQEDENSTYVVVDSRGATFTIDEEDSRLSRPPFVRRNYSPPPGSPRWLPLKLWAWNWVFGGLVVVAAALLPLTVLSLAIPIASFFALPALLLEIGVLFYAIPVFAYLLLAQSAPPPHAELPFHPPIRNLRLLTKINIAVLQWTQRAIYSIWAVLPEVIKTKMLYTAARGWPDRIRTKVLYGSTYARNTLDVYLPKPVASGLLLQSASQPPQPTRRHLRTCFQKWMMASLGRNLARMGYCVVIPDITAFDDDVTDLRDASDSTSKQHSSVSGPSSAQSNSPKNHRMQSPSRIRETMEDLRRVMRWAVDHASKFGGDPQQIYLAGHGLGAHAVLLHCIQKAVVASRDALFKSMASSHNDEGGTDAPPSISISNGTRRVQEYGREIWAPKVQGLILLSPICDVEKQVLVESEQGVSHLSTVRRSLGPGQLPCIMHSPAHILHASRNIIDIEELPKKVLFLHGLNSVSRRGFDRVVNWSQSENMKELFRGVGVENVRSRVYTTGHTGVLTGFPKSSYEPYSRECGVRTYFSRIAENYTVTPSDLTQCCIDEYHSELVFGTSKS
ncbi:uncharacterized protein EI90DRAFT_3014475 [Cantharellus anzutake]|uniref:uncharacterized protein n=1 Tax=Cantharellus anzutake TaxID=1750568 RepID=UPI0019073A62|nr:uncharacterized protein EI90DRAFT_3014475 [Cantharellus anzutake]KAF8335872.1 hypothetical protein EI90DRAFT_3014475 [Cantharellus anzutake]